MFNLRIGFNVCKSLILENLFSKKQNNTTNAKHVPTTPEARQALRHLQQGVHAKNPDESGIIRRMADKLNPEKVLGTYVDPKQSQLLPEYPMIYEEQDISSVGILAVPLIVRA